MECSDKAELQRKCTAAWDAYESMFKKLGLPFDPTTKSFLPATPNQARKIAVYPLSCKTLLETEPYREFTAVVREYRNSCRALNRHLSTHRC